MDAAPLLWPVVGALAGTGHAAVLWRSAHHLHRPAWSVVVRLLLVAAVLTGAAVVQRLFPVAAGWACGFAVTACLLYAREAP